MNDQQAPENALTTADISRLMKLLPHRYPFMLVDRIFDMDRDESAVGLKNVTINEPFFQGHFPDFPVMPGVLIIEGLAQTAGALCVHSLGESYKPQLVYFMGIDNAKFRKPVVPGDQLRFELEMIRLKGRICKMRGTAYVDGEKVSEADLLSTIVDR